MSSGNEQPRKTEQTATDPPGRLSFEGTDRSLLLLAALGLASLALLAWAHWTWSRSVRQFVPAMDHLIEVKDSVADAHLWLEQYLHGNEEIDPQRIQRAYRHALASVDACLAGRSAVPGLAGAPIRSAALSGRLSELRDLIEQTSRIAAARCAPQDSGATEAIEDVQLLAAYHGLSLKSRSMNAQLQSEVASEMTRQRRLHLLGGAVWVLILGFSAHALARSTRRRRQAEIALQEAHDALAVKVEERTAELRTANEDLVSEVEERRQAQHALVASERELKRLSAQLLDVQEEERQRVARELHDSITQTLGAAKFALEHATQDPDMAAGAAASLRRTVVPLIQNTLDDVRQIYMGLRPSVLDDLGIVSAAGWLCRQFEKLHADVSLERNLAVAEEDIPHRLKIVIFRVLQEALSNVAKHSGARHVTVFLTTEDSALTLRVQDDGRGFPAQGRTEPAKALGVGLGSMKERVEATEGDFVVQSKPGSGTTLSARWALSNDHPPT